ncbi:MAG: hypothetical protein LBI34_02695 [Puniceicoccales bacterium]|jgi:hypothetical protein|nr:hypothetical protein [Puniceicoccales bacterium]
MDATKLPNGVSQLDAVRYAPALGKLLNANAVSDSEDMKGTKTRTFDASAVTFEYLKGNEAHCLRNIC